MEEQNNKKDGKTCPCGCGACGCTSGGRWRGFVALRIVIGILVIGLAFWIGVKVGEFRSELFGFGRMGGFGGRAYPMMMRGGYGSMGAGAGGTTGTFQNHLPGSNGGETLPSTLQSSTAQ
jgi:hypothetical protein